MKFAYNLRMIIRSSTIVYVFYWNMNRLCLSLVKPMRVLLQPVLLTSDFPK